MKARPHSGPAARLRRIGGIALLATRAALRTRTVAALLGLLIVSLILLPTALKSDGTPEGALQILLSYTLGFAFAILCLATLWSACALFAAEIDSARFQLSAVKPVAPWEFWLGKWLALLLLNALLLLFVHGIVFGQITWRLHRDGWETFQRPASRYAAHPTLPTPRAEALAIYGQMAARDELPKGFSRRSVLRTLERKAPERYTELAPGSQDNWHFRLTRALRRGERLTVRMKFETAYSMRTMVKGVCALTSVETGRTVEVPLEDFTLKEIEFDVDTRAFGEAPATGFANFVLAFKHTGDPDRSSGLMLRFRKDIVILTPGGAFIGNMLRAALVQWSVLALLSALGLTLSVCFSLPVAAFTATLLLVLTLVGDSVVQVVSEEDAQKWSNRAGMVVSRTVNTLSSHALQAAPLASLTRGVRLEPRAILRSLAWNALCMPLLFACCGCLVLKRRELADIE